MHDDSHWDWETKYERDQEREVQRRTTRRVLLDARGTLRRQFEPDAPVATQQAIDILRRNGGL